MCGCICIYEFLSSVPSPQTNQCYKAARYSDQSTSVQESIPQLITVAREDSSYTDMVSFVPTTVNGYKRMVGTKSSSEEQMLDS